MFDFIMNFLAYLMSIGFMVWGSRMIYLYYKEYIPVIGTCIQILWDISGHKRANIEYDFKGEKFVVFKPGNWLEQGSFCKMKINPSKPKETITKYECFLFGLMIFCGLFLFLVQVGLINV